MKIGTTKERLFHAVLLAERLAEKKESLPILSCIKIEAHGKECVLSATNLEAGIEITIPSEIGEKGTVAIPAGVLSQTIRSISSDKINLRSEDSNLLVESKGTKTLIKAIPHDDFPTLPIHSKEKNISISRQHLLNGIGMVSYAASPSMIRPELGSVYVSIHAGFLTCVATDSFRLAEKKIPAAAGKNDTEFLLPIKHTAELVYILEHIDAEEVNLSVDDSQVVLISPNICYMSRVVDGSFPNYKEIIPKTSSTEATILKNDFIEMLRKARVFSGTDQHIGLHVYPKKKIFTATARSADVGEMSDSIDAALSGEDIDINFHIGYLSDCLSSIASDSITLEFSSTGKPLIIRGVSDSSFLYLVMPLNR
jgi:DNA polymerase III subunit beta